MKFSDLNLMEPILRALAEEGYQAPSPIQEKAVPVVLEGKDLLGCAQTGTGKTAAFSCPMLQLLSQKKKEGKKHSIQGLVLTPTRELAIQIGESFQRYGKYLPLRTGVVFGGVSQIPQVEKLKQGLDILIATPGRLNDLIGQGYVDLSGLKIFVLDEADRMLDMGFIHDVKKVLRKLPQERQTLLFSATMPDEILELVDTMLKHPVKVMVAPVSSTVETINQQVYMVDKPNKSKLLLHLLENPKITSALVFTRTKHGADRVARILHKAGIPAAAIHGDKSQGARQTALTRFKEGSIRVLVATDIAARGIDIDQLSHVFNYDLPDVPETYIHRIGRTGRAGAAGTAIAFCHGEEQENLRDIEKLMGKKIPVVEGHPYPMENPAPSQEAMPSAQKKGKKPTPSQKPVQEKKKASKPSVPKDRKEEQPKPKKQKREDSVSPSKAGERSSKPGPQKKREKHSGEQAQKPGRKSRKPAEHAASAREKQEPLVQEKKRPQIALEQEAHTQIKTVKRKWLSFWK